MSDDDITHELNQWQMLLFRANLIVLPILLVSVLGLGTWLVQSQYGVSQRLSIMEERLKHTALTDAVRVQILEMRQRVLTEVGENFPPKDLVRDVEDNKKDIRYVLDLIRTMKPHE